MIKGLFFDFDGVLTLEKHGTPTMVSYIAEQTKMPLSIIEAAYRKYNRDLLYGNITHRDMWQPFCREIGRDVPYEVLERSFLNMTLDPRMIEYIREKKSSCLIGMITDNKADRIQAILTQCGLKELFDVVVISANVHSRKTEKRIFEEALRQSGLQAAECVFIDNTPANLTVPAEMGFVTIYFDDEKREYEKLIF
ncbi:MAG: HAD-IA family hydrolase [Clostridia bacterium]|nr:HAD-IA family hydrolase [Clostridia bacterium]